MLPPTPATSIQFQSPNACNLCHQDQENAWSDQWVRQWYPRDYQAPVVERASLIDAARKNDWSRIGEMLERITDPDRDEIYATSLIRLIRSYPGEEKWLVFVQALQDRSPLVRGAAAEALGGYLTADTIPALLKAADDPYRLVRVRAAAALASLPPERLDAANRKIVEDATREFMSAMRTRPDDQTSYHNLGAFHAARGDYQRAVDCYALSHRIDPRAVPPLVNASIAHNMLGQNEQAEECLQKAVRLDPRNPAVNLNLGMLLGEMGRIEEAEQAFRTALEADPKSATAAYNLGVILAQRDVREAIRLCRLADQLRPDEPKYAYAVACFLQQSGDPEQAIAQLRRLLQSHPTFPDGYRMLGGLLMEQDRKAEAVEVFRRAASHPELPAQVRYFFQAQAEALSAP
jgi:tetratricopeptide (TPR) repeat protein